MCLALYTKLEIFGVLSDVSMFLTFYVSMHEATIYKTKVFTSF